MSDARAWGTGVTSMSCCSVDENGLVRQMPMKRNMHKTYIAHFPTVNKLCYVTLGGWRVEFRCSPMEHHVKIYRGSGIKNSQSKRISFTVPYVWRFRDGVQV